MTALEILRTGPLALVQDLGRCGWAHIGVTQSGAADRRAHALANRLVANPDDCATLEITLGGLAARVHGDAIEIAVTGADTNPAVNSRPFGSNSVRRVSDGDVISLSTPLTGLRSYLAVRGGIDAEPALGSRSYDTLSAIGPPPLRPGELLLVGALPDQFPRLEQAPVAPLTVEPLELRVAAGPRDDWFINPDALVGTDWTVSERSDRVGIRLVGDPVSHRWPDRQLPSEGATRGAIQVPPSGHPVVLGPDHPVTGGYPVIGVVVSADIDKIAQARPGQLIRMRWSLTARH